MASNNDINLRYDVDRSKFSMLNFGSKTRFRCLTLSKRSTLQICQQMSTVSLRQSHAIVLSSVCHRALLFRGTFCLSAWLKLRTVAIFMYASFEEDFSIELSLSVAEKLIFAHHKTARSIPLSVSRLALVFVQRLFLCDLQYFYTASTKQLFSAYFLFNRSFS